VDVLSLGFFVDSLKSLGVNSFNVSVLSVPPKLESGQRFYPNIIDKHYYSDSYNYQYIDKLEIGDDNIKTSLALKYIIPNQKLEAGLDFGNMMSLTLGQTQANTLRILKFMYTLSPQWLEDLAKLFTDFFKYHELKELDLYYDRAANNFSKANQDFAGQFKKHIEQQDGNYTGWVVNLMSRNQGNISQSAEYEMMIKIAKGDHPKLPRLLIDRNECRPLKSSIEKAPIKITKSGERTVIQKDKSSEKLPIDRLPMESTNPSDSMKYLICRPAWLKVASEQKSIRFSDPSTV
ncbi:MAG: hypothetical protein LAT81_15040, partial [Oceanicaulis sp.]|nr:hypothetical protein [Oceanicaulis sp.]